MGEFVLELWAFMRERKKFWLLPIVVVLLLFGGLIVLAMNLRPRGLLDAGTLRAFKRFRGKDRANARA